MCFRGRPNQRFWGSAEPNLFQEIGGIEAFNWNSSAEPNYFAEPRQIKNLLPFIISKIELISSSVVHFCKYLLPWGSFFWDIFQLYDG